MMMTCRLLTIVCYGRGERKTFRCPNESSGALLVNGPPPQEKDSDRGDLSQLVSFSPGDPGSGKVLASETFSHQGGDRIFHTPEHSVDVALRVRRV